MLFSVVIPTYNRLPLLLKVIDALKSQVDAPGFEIIIVDDGSEQSTKEAIKKIEGIKAFFQQNSGPAVARNRGAEEAQGDYIVFIGDDTVPEPNFLAEHAKVLKASNLNKWIACLGYTKWPAEYNATKFMHYINEYGAQFGYKLINDGDVVPYNFFYTSNISLSRELLLQYPFNTSFPNAAWEDIELAYRLEKRGLKIIYNAKAITSHFHPMDIDSFCKRQYVVGRSAIHFYNIHPHLKTLLSIDRLADYKPLKGFKLYKARFKVKLADKIPSYDATSSYDKLIFDSYMKGLKESFAIKNSA